MAETYNIIWDDGSSITRGDGQPTYEGKAAPSYGTDEAKWQIKKFFYDGSDNLVKWVYANGNAGFVHVYDDRAGYTYTFTGS